MFPGWETIPFHFIWISLTLLYGFRTWPLGPTLWVLGAVMVLTAAGIGVDVFRGRSRRGADRGPADGGGVRRDGLARPSQAVRPSARYRLIAEQNARLLADQRRFLQDAAHQLRTPITIALGHAELLASALAATSRRARTSRSSSAS